MIDFCLEIPFPLNLEYTSLIVDNIIGIKSAVYKGDEICRVVLPDNKYIFNMKYICFIVIGDLIVPSHYKSRDAYYNNLFTNFSEDSLKELKGHFYLICVDKINIQINVFNSLFSIFPIYYYQNCGKIYIASKVSLIERLSNENIPFNYRFILENVLFYYPLFDQTYLKDVKLLKSNSFLTMNSTGVFTTTHTCIEDFFCRDLLPWKKSVSLLADHYISQCECYFPDEYFEIALTGGFDGRTLAACALNNNNFFGTYCFGSEQSLDAKYAQEMSDLSQLPYKYYSLSDVYIKDNSLSNGLDFIDNAEGTASFARAHYLFSVKQLAKTSKYLVTGNFGSDVLRGYNVMGVVSSPNLVKLFKAKNFDKGTNEIYSSYEMSLLNNVFFKESIESLNEDIKSLPCFCKEYDDLTLNQKFYKIVFEEIFRKYFGAEIVNQSKYLYNRTPYLDFSFLKELFKSELAGVNMTFFERNPLRRFRGQALYPYIINKTYPIFGKIKTDNGYRPVDLLGLLGYANIIGGYMNKKFFKVKKPRDPFSVIKAFENNKDYFSSLKLAESIFNAKLINGQFNKPDKTDAFFIALSQIYWHSKICEHR